MRSREVEDSGKVSKGAYRDLCAASIEIETTTVSRRGVGAHIAVIDGNLRPGNTFVCIPRLCGGGYGRTENQNQYRASGQ
jgi:hypothetical protein